ncbi:MAG: hypothetical protein M1355_01800 [Patescibacteria group bacterium]|nr:hypothetical protein [Patescibacteria group bacterium]
MKKDTRERFMNEWNRALHSIADIRFVIECDGTIPDKDVYRFELQKLEKALYDSRNRFQRLDQEEDWKKIMRIRR